MDTLHRLGALGLLGLVGLSGTAFAQVPDLEVTDIALVRDGNTIDWDLTFTNVDTIRAAGEVIVQGWFSRDDQLGDDRGAGGFRVDIRLLPGAFRVQSNTGVPTDDVVTHDPCAWPWFLGEVRRSDPNQREDNDANNVLAVPLPGCEMVTVDPNPPFDPVLLDGFTIRRTWSAEDLGLPSPLGGLGFTDAGEQLLVVGASETPQSAVYAFDLIRDPQARIVDLTPAGVAFEGALPSDPDQASGISAGLAFRNPDTLFYTYWYDNAIASRPLDPSGTFGDETRREMLLEPSIAGLVWSPALFAWVASSWPGNGVFALNDTEPRIVIDDRLATLPEGAGGLAIVPDGPWQGDLLYADWTNGAIRRLATDPTSGIPIDATTRDPQWGTPSPLVGSLAEGLARGPWGLAFDPLAADLLFATRSEGVDRLSIVDGAGFVRAAPVAESLGYATNRRTIRIRLSATDADSANLSYVIVDGPNHGELKGQAPNFRYDPDEVSRPLTDTITYFATDGVFESELATIGIQRDPGACSSVGFAGASWLFGVVLFARRRRLTRR
ncbi:MAG: hypothetical protein AAF211_22900 [Myxococcota bacterium]